MTDEFAAASAGVPLPDLQGETLLARILSFPMFLGVLLIAGVFVSVRVTPTDPDTWWHVAVGERILQQRRLPTTDSYSFTAAGTFWIAYEWLGEVAMASADVLGGLRGRTGLLLAASSALFLLLFYYSYLRCGNVKAAFIACTLVLPSAAAFFTLRPQIFGYALLLVTLIYLEKFHQGTRRVLWVVPFIFLVWVNLHGSFALGLATLALFWFCGLTSFRWGGVVAERWAYTQRLHLALIFLLSLIALCLTPYGTRLAAYPLEMALFQPINTGNIQEWQPLGPQLLLGTIFLALLLFLFVGQTLAGLSYRLDEIGLLIAAALAASLHRRFLIFFVLVSTPIIARMLAAWVPPYDPTKNRRVLNAAIIVVIIVAMLATFPSERVLQARVSRDYPEKAVGFMREHPVQGPMLNEYGWGGYLIWALAPQQKVFIDGRADIYEYAGVLTDYMTLSQLKPGALSVLSKYGIGACLLRRDSPLAVVLGALPDWERMYADDVSILLRKRNSARGSARANSE